MIYPERGDKYFFDLFVFQELDLAVQTLATYPEMNNPIKMEVGIEECLHIEFEYNKSKYHLKEKDNRSELPCSIYFITPLFTTHYFMGR